MAVLSFLDRERTVAGAGFTRWLVPPAALSVHLAIGEVYGFNVFNKPLSQLIGVTKSAPGDWDIATIGWIFSVAIVFLGLSAAVFGKWVDRVGPRKTMLTSAICFGTGFLIAALGVKIHSLPVVILGYGVIGGIGLGLGYISPVSTLIKWFPDRPGMATGMAIMGFGGGSLIGSPLGVILMDKFKTPTSTGVAETFVVMGIGYFIFMLLGALIVRVPPADWKPAGYVAPVKSSGLITTANVTADQAIKTPQFWLLWVVLFVNVTAGIGVLGQASLMLQETFASHFPNTAAAVAAGAGFSALLSFFNIIGRFFWSSLSDYIGRKNVYMIYFVLGAILYALVPTFGNAGNIVLFVLAFGVILSMYGGGFATVPAYLRDLFGTMQVGAIHGRLLTAWAAAGVAGPVLVNYLRDYQIKTLHTPASQAYNMTMYIMAGLLVIGFICNFLVRPVNERFHYVEPRRAPFAPGTEQRAAA
jgi:MFS family permease